jgi:hypothetical protein
MSNKFYVYRFSHCKGHSLEKKFMKRKSVRDSRLFFSDGWKIPLSIINLHSWEAKYVNGKIHSKLL